MIYVFVLPPMFGVVEGKLPLPHPGVEKFDGMPWKKIFPGGAEK